MRELVALFGTLGVIRFDGPAAHIALMWREVVERERGRPGRPGGGHRSPG